MTWLLAGATVIAIQGIYALINQATGNSLNRLLYRLAPVDPGLTRELLLWSGLSALAYVGAFLAWRTVLDLQRQEPRPGDPMETLSESMEPLGVHGSTWPLALLALVAMGAVVTLAQVSERDLPAGLTVVQVVVFVSLVGNYAFGPPRPKRSKLAPVAVDRVEMSSLDERLKRLKESPFYRGQIRSDNRMEAVASRTVPASAEEPQASFWASAGSGEVYQHQQRVLDLLMDGSDPIAGRRALLTTARGSGVLETVGAAVLQTLAAGGNCLVIAPDRAAAEGFRRHFAELMLRGVLPWVPTLRIMEEVPVEPGSSEPLVEVVISTPAALHANLLGQLEEWRGWLGNLGLLCAVEMDEYQGLDGGHAAMVLRRLRRVAEMLGLAPALLATGANVRDIQTRCEQLWSWRFPDRCVVYADTAPAAERRLILWQPQLTLESREGSGDGGLRFGRNTYLDEAKLLLLALVTCGLRPVLVTEFSPITRQDLQDVERALSEQLGADAPPVVGSFRQIWDLPQCPNSVVTFAFPDDLDALEHETRHLAQAPGLLLFVVAAPTAGAQLLVRQILGGKAPLADACRRPQDGASSFLAVQNESIATRHLRWALQELPSTVEDLVHLTGDLTGVLVQQLLDEGFLTSTQHDAVRAGKLEPVAQLTCSSLPAVRAPDDLRASTEDCVKLRVDSDVISVVDRALVNGLAYPGQIMNVGRRRYRVNQVLGALRDSLVQLTPYGDDDVTVRATSLNVGEVLPGAWLRRTNQFFVQEGLRIRVGAADVRVHEDVLGFHSITWLDPPRGGVSQALGTPLTSEFTTRALVLSFSQESNTALTPEVLHALKHAFRAVLPYLVSARADEFAIAIDTRCGALENAPAMFILDYAVDGNGMADVLAGRVKDLFQLALELLCTCPCERGCLSCLRLLDCQQIEANQGLDKAGAIEILALLLDRPEVSGDIRRIRIEPVTEPDDAGRIARVVLRVLEERLGMVLPATELAPLVLFGEEAAAQDERLKAVLGLFQHEPRRVYVKKIPQEAMTGVTAHEYAHNWEFVRGNIAPSILSLHDDADRKFLYALLIEGFAEWVQYKVLDMLGYVQEMHGVEQYLTTSPQYPEGFRFFRYIEDQQGQQGPIEFMRSGTTPDDLLEKLQRAGCVMRLANLYGELPPDWYVASMGAPSARSVQPEASTDPPPSGDQPEDTPQDHPPAPGA